MKLEEIKVGDIICWRGEGLVFNILSTILSLFDSTWRHRNPKYWHMAFIHGQDKDGDWLICEATMPCVRTMPLSILEQIYGKDYKVYPWFDQPFPQGQLEPFVKEHLGCKYDVGIYFLTIAQELAARWFHIALPRLLNSAYSCWELVEEYCDFYGNPWHSTHNVKHRYPIISDFLNEAEEAIADENRGSKSVCPAIP